MSDLDNLKASPRVPKEGGETKKCRLAAIITGKDDVICPEE